MGDEYQINLDNLQEDWWRQLPTCLTLSGYFNRHLVGLFVRGSSKNRSFHQMFTGFPIEFGNSLLWFTAGHIVKEVEENINNGTIEISKMRWLDGMNIKGADSVPVLAKNPKMFWQLDETSDIGVISIDGLEAELIRRNEELLIFDSEIWRNVERANPEGYYLVGYPKEWNKSKRERFSTKQTKLVFEANIACLPVLKINHSSLPGHIKKVWKDTKSFYGKILDFPEGSEYQPEDISGMSGGPLLSIERRDNRMYYRLYGIQSKWFPDSRIIRVQLLHEYLEVLNIA